MSEKHPESDYEISNTRANIRAEREAAVEHAAVCLARAVESEAKADEAIELLLERTAQFTGDLWLRTQQRDQALEMAVRLGKAVEELLSSTAAVIGKLRQDARDSRTIRQAEKISGSDELNWPSALEATKTMYVRCREAAYVSPEDTARHLQIVVEICAELNKVVAALKIR